MPSRKPAPPPAAEADGRWIDYLPLAELRLARRNPKVHDDESLDASLSRFGIVEPMVLDERTRRLVSGHGRHARLVAALVAGDPPPDGVVVTDDGVWTVPVVRGWRSRNDREADAALVAVNRLIEAGGWDLAGLAALLSPLAADPAGLAGVGYTAKEVSALAASLPKPEVGGAGVGEGVSDRSAGYFGSGVRSFVLDYPLADFDRVARLAGELRRHRDLPTNADLVAVLAAEACTAAGLRLGDD